MKKLEDILSKAITKRSIFVSSFTWISLNYYHFKKLENLIWIHEHEWTFGLLGILIKIFAKVNHI